MRFLDTIIHTDLPFIVEAFTVLHYDQEPILFTGFNRKNNRILGSSVETNYKDKYELHFHSIIEENVYNDFIAKKITYQKILSDTGFIFAIKSSFDNTDIKVYGISYESIPKKFIPSSDSYCPDIDFISSLDYNVKLDGLDASKHIADPENVHIISQGVIGIIMGGVNSLYNRLYDAKVCYGGGGYLKSSFKINLRVELSPIRKEGNPNLFNEEPQKDYINFIKDYVDYSLNDLGSEIESISKEGDRSEALNDIIRKAKNLSSTLYRVDDKSIEDNFIEEVKKSAKELKQISHTLGDGYSTISISNVSIDGSEHVLGYIDSGFKDKIESAFEIVDAKVSNKKDDSPTSYTVYIDHLNASNRSGNAIIQEDVNVWKPKFKIKGEKPLNNTKFSESLHKKKNIKVNAIATRNGLTREILHLLIEEE